MEERAESVLLEVLDNDEQFPNILLASILMSLAHPKLVNFKIFETLLAGYLLEPRRYLIDLISALSEHSNLVHSVVSEYLNSGTWEERCAACTLIGHMDTAHLSAALVEKLVTLVWDDGQEKVRSAAMAALGRTGRFFISFSIIFFYLSIILATKKFWSMFTSSWLTASTKKI